MGRRRSEAEVAASFEGWHPDRVELRCALYVHAQLLDRCVEDMLRAPTLWEPEEIRLAWANLTLARHFLKLARPACRAGDWLAAGKNARIAVAKLDDFLGLRASMLARIAVLHAAGASGGARERQRRIQELLKANEGRIALVVAEARERYTKLTDILDHVVKAPELQDLAIGEDPALTRGRLRKALPKLFEGSRGPARRSDDGGR